MHFKVSLWLHFTEDGIRETRMETEKPLEVLGKDQVRSNSQIDDWSRVILGVEQSASYRKGH